MYKYLIIGILLVVALYVYFRIESFVADVKSYPAYVASLLNQNVPFSRVFSKDAYNLSKAGGNPPGLTDKIVDMNY